MASTSSEANNLKSEHKAQKKAKQNFFQQVLIKYSGTNNENEMEFVFWRLWAGDLIWFLKTGPQ